MRPIPDIIISAGVIVAVAPIATGHRWVGVVSFLVALIVGWKRNWCLESVESFASSPDDDESGHDEGADGSKD